MKFQFDPHQQYQLEAISSVIKLFEGQTFNTERMAHKMRNPQSSSSPSLASLSSYSNYLNLTDEQFNKNLKTVQNTNQIISQENIESKGRNFSIEMETGTGKTYIYLRTIFELNKEYGFKKFIVVVPSVAVREGVLKSLEMMTSHFKQLYNNIFFEKFVYQSRKSNVLSQFARGHHLQIMIINIDAFNKDSNIIRMERDQTGDIKPIDFIKATHPIVIMDEPQNMESDKSKQAIESLNPLCTLRYSATHRNLYNPIYCLNPVQAFQKKLVKKISVASVVEENDPTQAYVKLIKTTNRNNKIISTLQFFKNTKDGRKLIKRVCKQFDDLYIFSNQNIMYKHGFKVYKINCESGMEFLQFTNGVRLKLGQEQGGYREDVIKAQIRETIKTHFEKEIQLKNQGIKVLSLFFLDRVENYRLYRNNQAILGVYGQWFEEIYTELAKNYQNQLEIIPVERVHNGYFSKDKKGVLKNTRGNTQEDVNTYSLIMKDKEKLLDSNDPLKFIFSHSALREGWDNPNIFQICTLNETSSYLKKRQEIGRGLRLPVNQNGERIQDDLVNHLVIVANESYTDFVSNLQKEMEEDCGLIFGSLPINAFVGITFQKEGPGCQISQEESKEIWDHLKQSDYLATNGYIKETLKQAIENKKLVLPEKFQSLTNEVIEIVQQYQLESHIRKHSHKVKAQINEKALLDPEFEKFWKTISQKTIYATDYDSQELIKKVADVIEKMEAIDPLKIAVHKANIKFQSKGISSQVIETPESYHLQMEGKNMPNVLSYIQKKTNMTRQTIFEILKYSGRLDRDFMHNPQKFMDLVVKEIQHVLHQLIIEGIQYKKLDNTYYEMSQFRIDEHKMEFINDKIVPSEKSIYDYIHYDSEIEKNFAEALENMRNIKYFIKLPYWFKVKTPVGHYNPDWAILKKNGNVLYMIRETKSTLKALGLRGLEKAKLECGVKHFESIQVNYKVCTSVKDASL